MYILDAFMDPPNKKNGSFSSITSAVLLAAPELVERQPGSQSLHLPKHLENEDIISYMNN